jgi:hypothetical protein
MVRGCLFLASSNANSGFLENVDLDGKIGLSEVVNVLQVASRIRTTLRASCVFVRKSDWASGQAYLVNKPIFCIDNVDNLALFDYKMT